MKKLMVLGGSCYVVPLIKKAQELGIHVITCDYEPDNEAHRYSDEYCNVSVVDKEALLEKARELDIDGIVSFACDSGVAPAAFVAEEMGLPFQCSYESASILQDKGRFRRFLADNGFNTPLAKRFDDREVSESDLSGLTWPLIVKPVDSAGSKGVTRIDSFEEMPAAADTALMYSRNKAFIIEEFLEFEGYHSSVDPFTVNGELKFVTYSDQLFDGDATNPYKPLMIIWPTTMRAECQELLTSETQRLMNLLQMKHGIYNIETCVGSDGRPFIMEVSPRGGGYRIAEIEKMAYGIDLIENEVRQAVGMDLLKIAPQPCDGCWCEMAIFADHGQTGKFEGIAIAADMQSKHVKQLIVTAKQGDVITGSDIVLGDLFLRFDSREELNEAMSRMRDWLTVEVS